MTTSRPRHVELDVDQDVGSWPAEAVEAAIDRGSLGDWRRLATEIRRSPWGATARAVMVVVSWSEHPGVDEVLRSVVEEARAHLAATGRARWAGYLRDLRTATGMSMRDFAALAGTSASRLSDYENARTSPTTDTLARIEHAASLGSAATSSLGKAAADPLASRPQDGAPRRP